ncbi:MAG: FAD-dependent oxidoreductase [Saprospiraceae bacterium]|nr:FAD-dependent oxidoreductase [Saprospiraceae bacterium]
MAWKWYDSTVVRMEDAAPGVRRFWLQVPEQEPIEFKAGQFVTMDLPIHEKRLKRWRSYSIANSPTEKNLLEFCIVRLEGGAASDYFFDQLKVGDAVRFKGPDGNFVLPDDLSDRELVLVCTGTGVAPFRSMLLDIEQRNIPYKSIHLIFGTRYAAGILYREDFERMTRNMPHFRYSVALSREAGIRPEDFAFPVFQGYVHQIYMDAYPTPRPELDFYLCGWSNMIDDAVANLLVKRGCEKSRIHYELYG